MGKRAAIERSMPANLVETQKPGLYVDASPSGMVGLLREASQVAETAGNNDLAFKLTAVARKLDERPRCEHCESTLHTSSQCYMVGGTEGMVEREEVES